MADMKILKKYDSGRSYDRFTTTDSCFYFKPQFADVSEQQFKFKWTLMNTWLCITKSYKPKDTKRLSRLSTTKQANKKTHTSTKLRSEISADFADVAKANGTYEDYALFNDDRNYGWTDHTPSVLIATLVSLEKLLLQVVVIVVV